jgi:uncharacterized protein YndB with AHSA1/START domain
METLNKTAITVEAVIHAPKEKVWELWTKAEHVIKWNNASEDWHTTKTENDLRTGGKFLSRMEAKDGSVGFDFIGTYDEVELNRKIAYTIADGRKVKVLFTSEGAKTKVVETFDADPTHTIDMQRGGWQSILDNFKSYAETN